MPGGSSEDAALCLLLLVPVCVCKWMCMRVRVCVCVCVYVCMHVSNLCVRPEPLHSRKEGCGGRGG
jgi:hypothetical protein